MNKDEIAIIIGQKIKDYRLAKGWTQEELAQKIGMGKSAIANYEKGFRSPKKATVFSLANVFEISIDDLFPQINKADTPSPSAKVIQLDRDLKGDYHTRWVIKGDNLLQEQTLRQAQLETQQAQEQAALQAQLLSETTVSEKVVPISDYVARKTKPVPGEASAGTGVWAQDADHEHSFRVDDLPDEGDYDTIAKVKGNSMLPIMADGDYLFIKLTSSVDANTIGIFQVDGENYVKKLRYSPDYRFYLESLNPDYDDIYLHEDSDIRTIGEVVEIYREN